MVTVSNQGQDDRYIRLWRRNMSHPAVSRSCDCHVFGQAFLSWKITEKSENDWIYLRTANNPSGKRRHCIFHFLVLFTTFSRQTSILRCVIMVDVFFPSTSYGILTFLFAVLELRNKKQWPRKPPIYFLKRAWF